MQFSGLDMHIFGSISSTVDCPAERMARINTWLRFDSSLCTAQEGARYARASERLISRNPGPSNRPIWGSDASPLIVLFAAVSLTWVNMVKIQ